MAIRPIAGKTSRPRVVGVSLGPRCSARSGWGVRLATVAVVSVLGASLLPQAAWAADPTPAQIISGLNTERTANGIPTVTEDANETSGCQAHVNYAIANNGWDANPHAETVGKPGYSVAGNRAASHSVLSWGTPGTPTGVYAFASAPYHQLGLFNPRLLYTGAWEGTGGSPSTRYGCIWVWTQNASDVDTPRPHPTAQRLFSMPGNGRTKVPWYVDAGESPKIPAYDV